MMYRRAAAVLLLLPLLAAAAPQEAGDIPEASEQRQSPVGQVFANVLQFPQNLVSSITRTRAATRIGEVCQYTTDCLEQTKNSVCFNGTCLCNLGYRYSTKTDECRPVEPCPACEVSECSNGHDAACDGSCVANFKKMIVDDKPIMLKSHQDWPKEYKANSDLYYCLKAPAGRRVNLKLLWLDLESRDSVIVYNGCVARSENIMAYYNGDNAGNNECVTSYCNEMLVRFQSDPDDGILSDQRTGFMGYYTESTYDEDKCLFKGIRPPTDD